MLQEAEAKDMDVGDYDIVPRILPHHVAWTKQYGKPSTWDLNLSSIWKVLDDAKTITFKR